MYMSIFKRRRSRFYTLLGRSVCLSVGLSVFKKFLALCHVFKNFWHTVFKKFGINLFINFKIHLGVIKME